MAQHAERGGYVGPLATVDGVDVGVVVVGGRGVADKVAPPESIKTKRGQSAWRSGVIEETIDWAGSTVPPGLRTGRITDLND